MGTQLWLRNCDEPVKLGVSSLNAEFEKLRRHGAHESQFIGISSDQAREQVRRMLYFLADFPDEKQGYLEQYLNSPTLLDWIRWQCEGVQLEFQEKNTLERKIYHVLQEHFTGVRLPEGSTQNDRRLYVTLSRRRSEVRQSAQVVLAELDWVNSTALKLAVTESATGERRKDLVLHGKDRIDGLKLPLKVPFLDYVMMRHFGELGEVLEASYLERLDCFKAQVQKKASAHDDERIMLVRLKTDHTFRRQRFAVNGNNLEVTDDLNYFPYTPDDVKAMQNPAIQLYGNRLFSDQTISELLSEFLLVVFSPKRAGYTVFETALPSREQLFAWDNEPLKYAPKARLNLKLFSFLGASRLESRHQTHRVHHEQLVQNCTVKFRSRIPSINKILFAPSKTCSWGFRAQAAGDLVRSKLFADFVWVSFWRIDLEGSKSRKRQCRRLVRAD
jgi:hypothetical protein